MIHSAYGPAPDHRLVLQLNQTGPSTPSPHRRPQSGFRILLSPLPRHLRGSNRRTSEANGRTFGPVDISIQKSTLRPCRPGPNRPGSRQVLLPHPALAAAPRAITRPNAGGFLGARAVGRRRPSGGCGRQIACSGWASSTWPASTIHRRPAGRCGQSGGDFLPLLVAIAVGEGNQRPESPCTRNLA